METNKPLSTDPNLLVHEANRCFDAGRLREAAFLYEHLLNRFPPKEFVLNRLADIALASGSMAACVELLGRSLQMSPHQPIALAARGAALVRMRRLDEAMASYDRALALQPEFATVHYNRGVLLTEMKRPDEALSSYARALAVQPDFAEAYNNQGNLLKKQGRFDEALASLDRALAFKPDFAEAHNNRGLLLADLQRHHDALASYERAIAINSRYAEAHNNHGNLLKELERPEAALASYGQAIAVKPDFAEAHYNRGILLAELGRPEDALASYDEAIGIKTDFAEAHGNRGNQLGDLKRFEEALASYTRALEIRADYAEAYNNRGILLADLKRFDEAMADFDKAIALNPDYAEAHSQKAELLLLRGDFAQGWELYEWRWKSRFRPHHAQLVRYPIWTGAESVEGKAILLVPEVGLGDFLMFIRYAPLLRERAANVLVYAPKPLYTLFAAMGGGITVIEEGAALPHVDLQCPIMSLPRAFRTTVETIPTAVPYLQVASDKRNQWHRNLGKSTKPRIGLMWAGKIDRNIDRRPLRSRSVPLACLVRVLHLPLELHVLQQEISPPDADLLLRAGAVVHQHELRDFADTAALIQEMDLIISIDTSVAHLAGALGKPLWVMLPMASDYRWGTSGDKSPWYSTATLFRQTVVGDWDSVIARIADGLISRHASG